LASPDVVERLCGGT